MLRHRKIFANGVVEAGYVVIVKTADGVERQKFMHTRAGEYAHAAFCEKHRNNVNHKPYRSAALKVLARANAKMVNGHYISDAGVLHHT